MRPHVLPVVLETVWNNLTEHTVIHVCFPSSLIFISRYASVKILDGDLHNICCPAFACSKLVPLDLIEQVVSPSMARKYLKFDIKVSFHRKFSVSFGMFRNGFLGRGRPKNRSLEHEKLLKTTFYPQEISGQRWGSTGVPSPVSGPQ